ncbi:MAG TPA: ATP-binding protein [Cyclobacteriaceae bacterium]|jgi:HTH-type transcriptional repressor of NAD biosynthesis genes|nr:ATP-binding protein [Cyclobacteriaceae bacterium]
MTDRVKKVCFYGPESTGKSTMAKFMAELYHTVSVPEVSREFVSSNDFTIEDIIKIGHAQTGRILNAVQVANEIVFCDTDLITTQIYCRHYLKTVPPILLELEKRVSFDLYLLMDIDVPWVADGLRDLGERREEMFEVFKNELDARNISYKLVSGSWDERKKIVKKEIDHLLSLR